MAPAESDDLTPRVTFRPLGRDDLPLLHRWLTQPHVSKWWRDALADFAAVEAEYGPCIDGDDPTELFVVVSEGRDVGMIQRYLIADEPDWWPAFDGIVDVSNAAGLDYLIGEADVVGRGIGTAMIASFTATVFDWRPVDSIVVTVEQTNPASWRILEKAGYVRIWSGMLDSPDPSDDQPEHVYVLAGDHARSG